MTYLGESHLLFMGNVVCTLFDLLFVQLKLIPATSIMQPAQEQDYKKEWDEQLAVYTQKRSQCETTQREIKVVREDIEELRNKINTIVPPENQTTEDSETLHQQKETLLQQYQELNSQLNRMEVEHSQTKDPQIQQLITKLEALQKAHQELAFTPKAEEKQKANAELVELQKKVKNEEEVMAEKAREVQDYEKLLQDLQKEVTVLNQIQLETNTTQDLTSLEAQLAKLEQEEIHLAGQLDKELAQQSQQTEAQQKVQKDQLLQLTANNSHLSTTLSKLENELKKMSLPKPIDPSEMSKLEDSHRGVLKDIEELNKEVAVKKVEESKRKEELKKEKHREKRNFKQEIIEEQTLVDLHTKELNREKAKLTDTVKLRKSYVSQQSLQILQKQYERQQLKGRPNLQTEQKQREKVVRDNQMIKARITFLKQAAKESQEEAEEKLKGLKQKGDELVKEKLDNQKAFSDGTYKLKEYQKHFPDHEQKKEEAKNEQKRRKHQLKEKKAQQQMAAAAERQAKKAEQRKVLVQDSDETSWQKWDKWDQGGNMPTRDQKSIFNNRQFQIAAAVVALIAILVLSFS